MTLALSLLLTVAGGITAAHAGAATAVPVPSTVVSLPAGVEDLAPYVPQDSCDPSAKPGTLALARLLTATYPDTSIIGTAYACGTDGAVSEHYEGRALDWAIDPGNSHQVAEARALLAWLFGTDAHGVPAGNARRVGVMYALYDAQIIGTYNLAAGWRSVTCQGVTACHRDHVHLSLSWSGARGVTSWWSGSVAPTDYGPCRSAGLAMAATTGTPNPVPCASVAAPPSTPVGTSPTLSTLRDWSGATLVPGTLGPVVSALQTAIAAPTTAVFDGGTVLALQAFQAAHGVPVTGTTDAATWTALLGLSSTPAPVETPAAPVTSAGPLKSTAPVKSVRPVKQGHPVLRLGSHGISVGLVQALLGLPVTQLYSPRTGNAIRHLQRVHRLPVDGIVGPATWRVLGR